MSQQFFKTVARVGQITLPNILETSGLTIRDHLLHATYVELLPAASRQHFAAILYKTSHVTLSTRRGHTLQHFLALIIGYAARRILMSTYYVTKMATISLNKPFALEVKSPK